MVYGFYLSFSRSITRQQGAQSSFAVFLAFTEAKVDEFMPFDSEMGALALQSGAHGASARERERGVSANFVSASASVVFKSASADL